jgi:hypothetical protein
VGGAEGGDGEGGGAEDVAKRAGDGRVHLIPPVNGQIGQMLGCHELLISIIIMSITVSELSALGKHENHYFDNYF